MSGRDSLGKNNKLIIDHIKASGCRVRLYNKELIDNGQAAGTFHTTILGGIVSIGMANKHKKEIGLLLSHEFGHFLQWKTGFMDQIDKNLDNWTLFQEWLEGKNVPGNKLEVVRQNILLLEHDAYLRGWTSLKSAGIHPCPGTFYWNRAHSYICQIKHSFISRLWQPYTIMYMKKKALTPEELYAPLTHYEFVKITG